MLSLTPTQTAHAGTCTGSAPTWTCSGAADAANDARVDFSVTSGTLTVTGDPDFGLNVDGTEAIRMVGRGTGIDAKFYGPITGRGGANNSGIYASNAGSGATSIRTAAVTSTGGDAIDAQNLTSNASSLSITTTGAIDAAVTGIRARQSGTGDVTVNASGSITTGTKVPMNDMFAGTGIYAGSANGNTGSISVTASAAIMANAVGINAIHEGAGSISITASGDITSATEGGIRATTVNTGATDVTINASGSITAMTADKDGIFVDHQGSGSGAVSVTGAAITAGGRGIYAKVTDASATTLSITANGAISAADQGIYAIHQGGTALTIRANAAITSADEEGIRAVGNANSSGMTINAAAITAATSGKDGIHADHDGTGAVEITAAAITAGGNGINASAGNTAATTMMLTANGGIMADAVGIHADHDGSGDLSITANAAVSGTTGIAADTSATGSNIIVSVSAAITGTDTTNGAAISMTGGDSQTLTLNPGAVISGDISADADTATLRLAGASGSGSLNLAALNGFTAFEKTGEGSWTLTGAQDAANAFTSASFSAGTLRLGDGTTAATFRPGGSFTIPTQATLEVTSGSSITGDVTNSGTLNVAGASTVMGDLNNSAGAISLALGDAVDATDKLTVTGAFTAGGSVTLDVDLTGNTPAADELILMGSSTAGMVTVNLRIASDGNLDLTTDIENTGDNDPRSVMLVSGPGADDVTLVKAATDACEVIGDGTCDFELQQDADGNWTLETLQIAVTADIGGAQAAVVESYAASLADIAALSGLASRTANRHYANGNRRGFWAQIAASQTDTTPSFSTTGSSRDTGITRARFGLDAPLPLADLPLENLAIGANFWLAQTDSDITSRNGKGDIETDAFGFAASATLGHPPNNGSFYADAQLQHATFSSDLKAEGESVQSNHDATSWGAALELGYRLPPALHGISFTPQAQLIWSSIDFDAFTDAADERISIADGETLVARLGIAAESHLNLAGFGGAGGTGATAGSFRAALDVLLPLDGKTASNLGDSRLLSDMQDPALSLTAGGTFPLNATTTLAADLATTQGDETETYRASLSARFAF